LYPAVFLSGFDAAAVLKGNITRGKTGAVFRQSLVCFQFVITVFLIICTAFMALQMHFVTKERVGYNTEHKIMVRIPYNRPDAFKPLKNELLKHPDILQVTGSSAIPTETVGDKRNFYRAEDRSNPVMLAYVGIEDPLFFEFYGLKVQHGRNFDASKTTDRLVQSAATDLPMAFIVNESAARELGMSPEQAEGRTVVMPLQENSRATGTVIGVTRDTNFDSFKNDTLPIVFYLDETENSRVSIMTTGKNTASVVEHIEKTWLSILPEEPPKLRFVDAMFNNIYKNEAQQVQLFLLLSTLSIFLSLLGLYGLTAFNAQRMSKEIAIRKVLGASLNRIITLLSKEVIRLALLANLIAWPLAYLTMSSWLSAFVYRIELSWWLFITASAGAFALAWLTLAIHAVFVERRPVVHSLKYE
jgi:putative ABC transport system permease protein